MQFNYQNEYISQSPLDFNYSFGLNNNSADKFNYNSISIVSTMIDNISNVKSFNLPSTLINASELLIDNTTIEVSSIAMNTISFTKTLSTETLSKLNTKFDTTQFINSVLQTTFSGMNSVFNNVNGNTLANKWAKADDVKTTGITTNVWDSSKMDYQTPTNTKAAEALDIMNVTMSSINLIMTAVNFGFNLANQKSYNESYSNMIDKKIELLNENIEANREFMQQARDEIAKRQQRFSKSNRMINS